MDESLHKAVLVVEDNPAMNNAICDILELNNYRVYSASNGKEALDLLQKTRPHVILCDIMMPQMDGYTLLRHTRADDRLRTLPFIFLTARSSPEDKRQAKSIGIEDYLVKPVDPEDLILAVENALRRAEIVAMETQTQMDTLRSQIVRTLQHEFRTPLTFILGYAEYLVEVSGEQVDLDTLRISTNAILEGGHRLQDLIEKFLMLADIQFRQQLPGLTEYVNPHHLLQSAAKSMAKQASEVELEIIIEPWAGTDRIAGEVKYLHKSLVQLLENSIKYRRADSRHIWLGINQIEGYLGLKVRDESRGIPQDMVDKIQRPFEQAERDDRTIPGAGLSLAMVQHVARLHGGYLTVGSQEGKGSAFTLWLPTVVDDPMTPEA